MSIRPFFAVFVTITVLLIAPALCNAQAQIFRVGPDGQYATVSAALTDLLAAPHVNNWIKVQAGVTTTETLYFPTSWTTGAIWLSGTWDSSFTSQSGDPTDTVISGDLGGVVIKISVGGGTILISDLSIVDGYSGEGGGVRANPTGTTTVRLDNLNIWGNVSVTTGSGAGGGISAHLTDSTSLTIVDCEIHTNVASGPSSAYGGGVSITATDLTSFSLDSTVVADNDLWTDGQSGGAGIHLYVGGDAVGTMSDCTVRDNTVSSSTPILNEGTGVLATMDGASELTIERSRVTANTPDLPTDHEQVLFFGLGDSSVRFTDSVVAAGTWDGIYLRADDQSVFNLTNLTVADHDEDGIVCNRVLSSTASINLSNSISAENGGLNLNISSGPVTQIANVVDVDPEFVDPQDLDFRVEVGSVAEDAGVPAPLGGLGTADIRGGLRFLGAAPDAGAYEGNVSLIFSDGFELAFTGRWSDVVGALIQ